MNKEWYVEKNGRYAYVWRNPRKDVSLKLIDDEILSRCLAGESDKKALSATVITLLFCAVFFGFGLLVGAIL